MTRGSLPGAELDYRSTFSLSTDGEIERLCNGIAVFRGENCTLHDGEFVTNDDEAQKPEMQVQSGASHSERR